MKLLKAEKAEKSTYKLELSVDKETFDAAVNKVYRRQVKKINIPGFRAGKAPKAIIEKMYGKGVFYEDAINDILPTVYPDAVKEAGITPVGNPEFDIVSIDENGVVLSAVVPVKPEVTIDGYKGIEAVKNVKEVTDEEVDNEINVVRERNSREIEISDAPAKMGDTTVIDFEGYIDGELFEGGTGSDYHLTLGSGSFIPGFEEQIVGHNVNDNFDVNVTFPEDYHAAEFAGKPAVFKVTLKGISVKELPELDDDFAKDVSEFDTIDEYKADIKAKILTRHENAAENEYEEAIIKALVEKLEGEIPEAMFASEVENQLRDFDNRLRMQGLDLTTYCKYLNTDLDKMREQFRPQAETSVKLRLALETIAANENIEATEEEINNEHQYIADNYKLEIDKVKEMVDAEMIVADIKVKKAMTFVKENTVAPKAE